MSKSEERIETRKAGAIENARLHGRWIASSEGDVEKNLVLSKEHENNKKRIEEYLN